VTEALQQLLNGLSLGSTYALLALGLALVFTILGLVNFAHGELITVSSYSMLMMSYWGLPWAVFAPVGMLVAMLTALAMERVAFRPVRGASPTTMLLTSFGLSIAIQSLFTMAVSPRSRAVPQPDWSNALVEVAGLRIPAQQILTMVVTGIALLALTAVLRRTLIGTAMRAAAEDFDATRLMGIRANRVISTAFAISGLLAGIAAVLILTRRGAVNPTMGLLPVLKAFVANVIGGIGSLVGAVLGGFLLGIAEVALRAWLPGPATGFVDGFIFALVALLLLARPQGLFGRPAAVRT
jgi:branched-chain amino acid transport system permease protein